MKTLDLVLNEFFLVFNKDFCNVPFRPSGEKRHANEREREGERESAYAPLRSLPLFSLFSHGGSLSVQWKNPVFLILILILLFKIKFFKKETHSSNFPFSGIFFRYGYKMKMNKEVIEVEIPSEEDEVDDEVS